jgi:hypothetical protein
MEPRRRTERAGTNNVGGDEMPTTLRTAAESYLRAKALSRGTRIEYLSTLTKWEMWGGGGPIEGQRRKDIREFLDWVYERAVTDCGARLSGVIRKSAALPDEYYDSTQRPLSMSRGNRLR